MLSQHPKEDILGRLLVLQQTLYILPDERSLSKFLAAAMLDVPGVASCKVSLQGTSEAGAVFDHEGAPVEIPIQTPRTVFGHIFLSLNDPEVFRAYQPVIENIGQVVATSLENQWNASKLSEANRKLEQLVEELEQRVEERTQDIVRAKNELMLENQKNLAFLRNSSDGIHILDHDGNVVEASDSFCAMLRYSRDEVIGMNVSQWDAHFTGDGELIRALSSQFEKPTRSLFETRHRRKDGTVFDVEITGYPLEMAGKQVLFNSSRDITQRKQAEEKLKVALHRSKMLFESSRDALMTLAPPSWKFTSANQATIHIFGATSEGDITAIGPWSVP